MSLSFRLQNWRAIFLTLTQYHGGPTNNPYCIGAPYCTQAFVRFNTETTIDPFTFVDYYNYNLKRKQFQSQRHQKEFTLCNGETTPETGVKCGKRQKMALLSHS